MPKVTEQEEVRVRLAFWIGGVWASCHALSLPHPPVYGSLASHPGRVKRLGPFDRWGN